VPESENDKPKPHRDDAIVEIKRGHVPDDPPNEQQDDETPNQVPGLPDLNPDLGTIPDDPPAPGRKPSGDVPDKWP